MPCPISHNVALTQFAGAGQRCIIALRYVTVDEQMNGRATTSSWGVRRERRDEERERREGWKMGEKVGQSACWANESKVKAPLLWQLRACTLLFDSQTSTSSLRLRVLCFKVEAGLSSVVRTFNCDNICDVEAASKWNIWCGCCRASV